MQNGRHFHTLLSKAFSWINMDPFRLKYIWRYFTQRLINNIPVFGSDDDLTPARRQDIIWTNFG